MKNLDIVPIERIQQNIFIFRDQRVILDEDLADLYGVGTKRLNEQVRRNLDRFPNDFMFQLKQEEWRNLKSQFATTSSWGGRRTLPYVFTEYGVIMIANILNSQRAVLVSVQVVRAFIRLRELLKSNEVLSRKLDELEKKYDKQFNLVFTTIRHLIDEPSNKKEPIGFKVR